MRSLLVIILSITLLASSLAGASQVSSAQHEISTVIANLRREFVESSDYANARSALRTSTLNYRETCNNALSTVRGSIEYRQLDERISRLEAQRTWGTFDDHMTPAQLATVARQLLDLRSQRSAMESAVLANDSDVINAKLAMVDANGRLVALVRDFDESIASNPQFNAAKSRLDAAYAQRPHPPLIAGALPGVNSRCVASRV